MSYIDSINDKVIALDKSGNITYLNAACATTLSREITEIIGKNIWKLHPWFAGKTFYEAFLEVLEKSETKTFEWKSPRSDKFWEIKVFPCDEGVGATIRDITERKTVESALKESEEKYRNLVENSKDAIAMVDFKGNILFANKASETLTGYKLGEITNIREITPKNLWIKSISILLRARMGKPVPYFEYEIKKKDEKTVPVETGGQAILKNGKPVAIQIITRDITEHKKAQQALAERNKKLAESEASYRELYDAFGQVFIATDWDFNITHWNKAAENLSNVKAINAVGKKLSDILPESGFIDVNRYYNSLLEGKAAHFTVTTASRRIGEQSIFNVSVYPSASGILYIVEDKTEEETNRRLSAIGATAGMVGHDIRNPLQAIVGDVFLLKSNLIGKVNNDINDEVQESLTSIENNVSYINKIVADLQDYSRPLNPEVKDVDLSDLFAIVCRNIKVPSNVIFSTEVKHIKFKTDPEFLRRALVNLVTNAIQALPNGGKVDLTGFVSKGHIRITISDNGVGIPEEVKLRLFTPMVTTKAKGQGLGLAVVKRLVEALDGNITFESEIGKGAKFRIVLPMTKCIPGQVEKP